MPKDRAALRRPKAFYPLVDSVRRLRLFCGLYVDSHGSIPELYDHEADPGERVNLAGDPRWEKVRADLHQRLVAWYDPEKNPYRQKPSRQRS